MGRRARTDKGRWIARAATAAVALVAFATIGAQTSRAAFPGATGKLVFASEYGHRNFQGLWVANADGSNARQLDGSAVWNDAQPAVSPDGESVVFVSNQGGTNDLYTMPVDGSSRPHLIASLPGNESNPSWSADGATIVFTSDLGRAATTANQELETIRFDGTGLTRLTNNAFWDDEATFSPDGKKIAFVSNRSGADKIYSMNADGSNAVLLTADQGGGTYRPDYSPDGTRIAFDQADRGANVGVWTMSSSGGAYVHLTTQFDMHAHWSPDGTQIYFDSDVRSGTTRAQVYSVPATGGAVTQVTTNASTPQGNFASESSRTPALQPLTAPANTIVPTVAGTAKVGYLLRATDGAWSGTRPITYTYQWLHCMPVTPGQAFPCRPSQIAGATASTYRIQASDAGSGVYVDVIATNGAGTAQRTSAETSLVPALPGNGKIAFESTRAGDSEIYVSNPDGSGVTRLTNDPGADRHPAWSPDGTRLAFDSDRAGGVTSVLVMDATGANVRVLVAGRTPDWSPDGNTIVYESGGSVFAVPAAGGTPTRIGSGSSPVYSPDGTQIAYDAGGRIGVMGADGSSPTVVTQGGNDHEPAWSVDGRRVYYQSLPPAGGQWSIRSVAPDGSGDAQVFAGDVLGPEPSPDGTKIAYAQTPNADIHVANVDGSGAVNITNTSALEFNPSWQPGGARFSVDAGTAQFGPTLDGAIAAGEWSGATAFPLAYAGPGGATYSGTAYVLRDARNLYVAAVIDDGNGLNSLQPLFDNDGDGVHAIGDDGWVANLGVDFGGDDFWSGASYSDDGFGGGKNDVRSYGRYDAANKQVVFEVSHPLASGDVLHDIDAAAGSMLGFNLVYQSADDKTYAGYPATNPYDASNYGLLTIPRWVDTTPPQVAITAPTGPFVGRDTIVTAAATDNDTVTGVDFYVDGMYRATDTTPPYTFSWHDDGADGRAIRFTAVATDASALTASAEVGVTLDAAGPTSIVTNPADGSEAYGTAHLAADVSDKSGVAGVEFYAVEAGTEVSRLVGATAHAPYAVDWDTSGFADGDYSVRVRAVDVFGNVSFSAPITVALVNRRDTMKLVMARRLGSLDPSVATSAAAWQLERATCAGLVNYADSDAPRGSKLVPEAAVAAPDVTPIRAGQIWTFTVRDGFRFSDGTPVTAASFQRAFERALAPGNTSIASTYMPDLIGADAYHADRAPTISGISVDGNKISFALVGTRGDFLARLAVPFFCAVPADTPTGEQAGPIPSAGPYYVSFHDGGGIAGNVTASLRQNPYYGGVRPRNFQGIDYYEGIVQTDAESGVERGDYDYLVDGPVPADAARLLKAYSGGEGGKRFFVDKLLTQSFLTVNVGHGLMANPAIRKAIALGVDRSALAAAYDGDAGATPTDQYIPIGMDGFVDAKLYPLDAPDVARARGLVAGADATGKTITLLTCTEPRCTATNTILRQNLEAIGLNVAIDARPRAQQIDEQQSAAPTFDISLSAWTSDYADPYNTINALFSSANIPPNGSNDSRFSDPTYDTQMDDASSLLGDARSAAYAKLDAALAENAVPAVPLYQVNARDLFSAKIGCQVFQPMFGMDLAMLCNRSRPPAARAATAELTVDAPVAATGDVPTSGLSYRLFSNGGSSTPGGTQARVATPLTDMPLTDMPLTDMPLTDMPLTDMPLTDMPLTDMPLTDMGLETAAAALHDIPLSALPVRQGWDAILAPTALAGRPIEGLTLRDVLALSPLPPALDPDNHDASVDHVKLTDVDWSGSHIHLPFGALVAGRATVGSLPLTPAERATLETWCASHTGSCDPATLGTSTLVALSLEGAPLTDMPLTDMPLTDMPLTDMPLTDMPLPDMPTSASPLTDMPLTDMPLTAPLRALPLGRIIDAGSPVGNIPLGRLANATTLVAACATPPATVDCAAGTLKDAKAAGLLASGLTLGDVVDGADDLTLGQIGFYGDPPLTLLDLARSVPAGSGFTYGDLIAALVPRGSVPWETLSPALLVDSVVDRAAANLHASFVLDGVGVNAATVTVTLPTGFEYVAGTSRLTREGADAGALADPASDLANAVEKLTWTVPDVVFGDHYSIDFDARPGLEIGQAGASEAVSSGAGANADDAHAVEVTDTFEPNNAPAEAPLLTPGAAVDLSYIASSKDRDIYKIHVPDDAKSIGSRITVRLTNLPADYDLALLSTTPNTIRDSGKTGIPFPDPVIRDDGVDLAQTAPSLEPAPLQDVPGTAGLYVTQLSSNRAGHDAAGKLVQSDEDVSLIVRPSNAGHDVYVEVYGYNGATSRLPYTLSVKQRSRVDISCSPLPGGAGTIATPPTAFPDDLNTLFIVNAKRLGDVDGAAKEEQVLSALGGATGLAGRRDLGISGAVLPIDGYPDVEQLYADWAQAPCASDAANAVANAIAQKVDAIRATHPKLKYLVLVGGDDSIPHFRVPDLTTVANEQGYAGTFHDNEYNGALGEGNVLSDAPYADTDPVRITDGQAFVEDLVSARLPESSDAILTEISKFVSSKGTLAANSAYVAGYQMSDDSSNEIATALKSEIGASKVTTLIGEGWDRAQALPALTTNEKIVAFNAHFDHHRAKPAAGDPLLTIGDATGLAGAIYFTIGCHAGLAVSDAVVGPTSPLAPDWAQTITSQGGVMVGNTGYGYADSDFNLFSESLMTRFAGKLDGSVAIGDALQLAKREYYLSRTAFSAYDEKVLNETTMYGLPMYAVGRAPTSLDAPPATPTPAPPAPAHVRGTTSSTEPATSPLDTDPATGLAAAAFSADPDFGSGPLVGAGGHGRYFANAGQAQAPNYRPLEPYVQLDAARQAGDLVAHGVVIDALSSGDTSGFDPVFVYPDIDHSRPADLEPRYRDAAWPSKIPTLVSAGDAAGGVDQRLNLATGQFYVDSNGQPIQRNFTHIAGHVLYSTSADFVPPTIQQTIAFEAPGSVTFSVDATDVDEHAAPADVAFAEVVYRVDGDGDWHTLQLVHGDGSSFTGGAPFAGTHLEYVTTVCDRAGNCATSSNKGTYYEAQPLPQLASGGITIAPAGTVGDHGWYRSSVEVTIGAPNANVTLQYRLDGGPLTPYTAPFTIDRDGVHVLDVLGTDGSSARAAIPIDQTPPVITLTTPADGADYKLGAALAAVFGCADAGSGPASCTGASTVDTSTSGDHSFSVGATDFAGNTTTVSHAYGVDRPPTKPGQPHAQRNDDDGSFVLTWTPSKSNEGYDVTYTVFHKSANDAAWSQVAAGLTAPTLAFAPGQEKKGTWQYYVRATGGPVSTDGDPSDPIVVDARPTQPGKPVATSNPNRGAFELDWAPSVDPDGDAITYTLLHENRGDPGYSVVATTTEPRFVFGANTTAPEGEATWTYVVRATAGDLDSKQSPASDLVVSDQSNPVDPTVEPTGAPVVQNGWYKNSVAVAAVSHGDNALKLDNSAGSGVDDGRSQIAVDGGLPFASPYAVASDGAHDIVATVYDRVGNFSSSKPTVFRVDAAPPTVTVTCPSAPVIYGSVATAAWVAVDAGVGFDAAIPTRGTITLDTTKPDVQLSQQVHARDAFGHDGAGWCAYQVVWPFKGFFSPVRPGFNARTAGAAEPLKWSLGGDRGLAIVRSAVSAPIVCTGDPISDGRGATAIATTGPLQYDPVTGQYTLVWRTGLSFTGCRQLILTLTDGSVHRANFSFK